MAKFSRLMAVSLEYAPRTTPVSLFYNSRRRFAILP
jgi:hypothetical protein